MEGASALQSVLEDIRERPVRVFVVWEPVVLTDIAPPTTRVLARIPDRRVAQFWDRRRRLSQEIVRSILADPSKNGHGEEEINDKTIVWDTVVVFPPGARWESTFPSPEYHGYPVADVIDEVRRHLSGAESHDALEP